MESCKPEREKRGGVGDTKLEMSPVLLDQDNLVRKYDKDGLWHLLMTQCSCCITTCHNQLLRCFQSLLRKTNDNKPVV